MVLLAQFRPTNPPPSDASKFLANFKGHTTIVTRNGSDSSERRFTTPNIFTSSDYKYIKEGNDLGKEVYFTVNETSPKGRTAHNIESIRAIFTDDDTPRPAPRTDFTLPPSLTVLSSSSEAGNKYHHYWLTTTKDVDEWERVILGIIAKYDTDTQVHDLARILRVPGFANCKYNPPTLSTLVDNNGKVYEWNEILKAFPPVPKEKANVQTGKDAEGDYNEHTLCDRFRNPVKSGYISHSVNSIIMHMANDGRSESRIRKHLDQLYATVPEDVRQQYQNRYAAAYAQIGKWTKTAKSKVEERRAITSQAHRITHKKPIIPEALEWDWSVLKSNPIPEDAIPATMLQAAKEIGDWTATGQDPAILSAVFITSALLSKNILIHEIGDNLTTHCQSGICIVMDTGARKSSIYNQMNKPFFDFEDRIRAEWETEKHVNDSMAKALDAQISTLDKNYARLKSPGMGETLSYATNRGALLKSRSELQLKQPWLRSVDVTEEKLVRKLNDNKGCMAIISDDARQVINNIAGKYGKEGSTGESVYINALTGSSIMYERVGSEEEIAIQHPVLNALLFVQPDAALKLRNSDMFVPSGLAARLPMYFYPVSGADIVSNTKRRAIDSDKMAPYYTALQNICVQRIDNPLHVRLDDEGMAVCASMDRKFAKLLNKEWRGHYDKSNKLITLSIMYATCFAALEDPQFAMSFRDKEIENNSYNLPVKYLSMGFVFSMSLFGQSITSHQMIHYEALPRKAESLLTTLKKWYMEDKIDEGFVQCGMFSNSFGHALREYIPEIMDFLVKKGWLYTTLMTDERRKLNNGFPDKLVDKGDKIYHLNMEGINRREDMKLDDLEQAMIITGTKQ